MAQSGMLNLRGVTANLKSNVVAAKQIHPTDIAIISKKDKFKNRIPKKTCLKSQQFSIRLYI